MNHFFEQSNYVWCIFFRRWCYFVFIVCILKYHWIKISLDSFIFLPDVLVSFMLFSCCSLDIVYFSDQSFKQTCRHCTAYLHDVFLCIPTIWHYYVDSIFFLFLSVSFFQPFTLCENILRGSTDDFFMFCLYLVLLI